MKGTSDVDLDMSKIKIGPSNRYVKKDCYTKPKPLIVAIMIFRYSFGLTFQIFHRNFSDILYSSITAVSVTSSNFKILGQRSDRFLFAIIFTVR